MTARRNTCTAVLFLCSLLSAVIYLGLGTIPEVRGFAAVQRPPHSSQTTKASILARAEREKRDVSTLVRTGVRPLRRSLGLSLPTYKEALGSFTQLTEGSDPAINALLDRDHLFIELYGGTQRLLGRRMVEDVDPQYTVVRLEEDLLTFSDPDDNQVDMTGRAEEMIDFVQRVDEEYDTPVLYVQAPSKLSVTSLPQGLEDPTEAEASQFLSLLEEARVDTLDLRPAFQEAVEDDPQMVEELFFLEEGT